MRHQLWTTTLLLGTVAFAAPSANAQMAAGHMLEQPMATSGSDLRVALNNLMAEHAQLGLAATAAALGGRSGEFQAAAAALDANSVSLSQAIGSVYGQGAQDAFLALWRKHIGFIVD